MVALNKRQVWRITMAAGIAAGLMPLIGLPLLVWIGGALAERFSIEGSMLIGLLSDGLLVLASIASGLVSSVAYRNADLSGILIGAAAAVTWNCLLPAWSLCAFALVAGSTTSGWCVVAFGKSSLRQRTSK